MNSMWTRNQGDHTIQDIERWSGPPPDSFWAKWFGGLIVPVVVLVPGIRTIVTRTGFIPGKGQSRLDLHGTDAVLLGCALACLAVFFHMHYFWGRSQRFIMIHYVGKTFSLFGLAVFLIWLLCRLFRISFGI